MHDQETLCFLMAPLERSVELEVANLLYSKNAWLRRMRATLRSRASSGDSRRRFLFWKHFEI